MKNLIAASVATLLIASAAPAFAQSAFDGGYVGGGAGYGFSSLEIEGASGTIETNGDGFVGGAFAGFGQSIESFYLGVEGNIDFSEIETNVDVAGVKRDLNRKMSAGIAARAGFLPTEDLLIFASAGIVGVKYEGDTDDWSRGYRIGAGVDKSLSEDLFVRGSIDMDFVEMGDEKLTTTTGKVGVGFKF